MCGTPNADAIRCLAHFHPPGHVRGAVPRQPRSVGALRVDPDELHQRRAHAADLERAGAELARDVLDSAQRHREQLQRHDVVAAAQERRADVLPRRQVRRRQRHDADVALLQAEQPQPAGQHDAARRGVARVRKGGLGEPDVGAAHGLDVQGAGSEQHRVRLGGAAAAAGCDAPVRVREPRHPRVLLHHDALLPALHQVGSDRALRAGPAPGASRQAPGHRAVAAQGHRGRLLPPAQDVEHPRDRHARVVHDRGAWRRAALLSSALLCVCGRA
ncbi:hypothetical protein PybrP1_009329 [[Pythium] brassicae (nom. inval.)]|nr:hypothetical protein PybrP1_009329 [[Pythium] brassicae (nom. inval.)]